jgi:hypothetical protein
LREERKKQKELLALLSQQLKKAENSMKGIEQEVCCNLVLACDFNNYCRKM